MAEAAAAFYTVETAVEGAVIGTAVVAQSTVPLHIRFYNIQSPDPSLALSSQSLNIVKGKAYIFGGDRGDGSSDNAVKILSLPTDLALNDIDYQSVDAIAAPERPLAAYSDKPSNDSGNGGTLINVASQVPLPRAAHSAVSIDSNIYIFGGRNPNNGAQDRTTLLDESGMVYTFSTITRKWAGLLPHPTRCSSGFPSPRTYASMASTPHPLPNNAQLITTEAHGTIFLHGGYDTEGNLLRDVWTFDVSSRVWSRWPDIPTPGPEDVASEGNICCITNRLWRIGDGFGRVAYMEIVRDDANDGSGRSELGVSPKTGEWKVLSFDETKPDQDTAGQGDETNPNSGTTRSDSLPVPRKGANLVPITTGAGREYLLYSMGEDGANSNLSDMWTFQLPSEKMSAAILKDKIRAKFGAKTGEQHWARCEVLQSSKEDGVLKLPHGLSRSASSAWTDLGGAAALIWGGKTADGTIQNEGWVALVD